MNYLNESLAHESGLELDDLYDDNKLKKTEWFYTNEEAIIIELAESGADREMDFDIKAEFDKRYEKYLNNK